MPKLRPVLLLIALMLLSVAISQAQQPVPDGFVQVQALIPEVLNVYPHDSEAFTQGLLWQDGFLYESTGLRGESSLRRVDLTTGEVLEQFDIRRTIEELQGANPKPEYFAEGLEWVNDKLYQLTWIEGEMFIYNPETFERESIVNYEGEGWGLCYDERYLYMSDSTQFLAIREADSFDLIGRMLVTFNGQPLQAQLLNELECVGDSVYANLWQTDYIAVIDKFNGNITHLIDTSSLLTDEERDDLTSNQVLNGIAYNPESDTFYITGKQWSKLFEVRFVPAPVEGAG